MTEELFKKSEGWGKTFLFFIPRVIANLFNSLTMDDNGYSWKKMISGYSVYGAMEFTRARINDYNAIEFVLIWIIFAGILIGAYSLPDIMSAISKLRGNENDKQKEKDAA